MGQEPPVDAVKLARAFRSFPGVSAVYLFGSMADGTDNPTSDLDLAVIPRSSGLRADKLELLAALTEEGFDNIDLVVLQGEDPFLEYSAVAPNVLVYAGEGFDRGATYSKAVRRYLDIEPYLKRQRSAYRQNLLDG